MFLELTKSGTDDFSGAKMLIPLDFIATISDNLNKDKEDRDNTYIRLKNNSYFFVRETFDEIKVKLESK